MVLGRNLEYLEKTHSAGTEPVSGCAASCPTVPLQLWIPYVGVNECVCPVKHWKPIGGVSPLLTQWPLGQTPFTSRTLIMIKIIIRNFVSLMLNGPSTLLPLLRVGVTDIPVNSCPPLVRSDYCLCCCKTFILCVLGVLPHCCHNIVYWME